MATRVNFNVFRYGKTIKWNFISPSTNFNKLIRASYVFNKWCPRILKHFDITALKCIFKIESLDAQIIFIGYRRIHFQNTSEFYLAGSAFHSKYTEMDDFIFPRLPLINDAKFVGFTKLVYHHVPKDRFLRPLDNSYNMVKKVFQKSSLTNFKPIYTRSDSDSNVQGFFFTNYQLRDFFKSSFFDRYSLSCVSRPRSLPLHIKRFLYNRIVNEQARNDAFSKGIFRASLLKRSSLKPRIARIFGAGLGPSDAMLFLYASLHKIFVKVKKAAARVSNALKLLKILKYLIGLKEFELSRIRILELEVDTGVIEAQLRYAIRLESLTYSRLNAARAAFKLTTRVFKKLKKKILLKKGLSALSHYLTVHKEIFRASSPFNLKNTFFFHNFLRSKTLKKLKFSKRIARIVTPDFVFHRKKILGFKHLSKTFFSFIGSKRNKSRFFINKGFAVRAGFIKIILLYNALNRQLISNQKKKFVNLKVKKKGGITKEYDYCFSNRRRALKRVNFFLKKIYLHFRKTFLKKKPVFARRKNKLIVASFNTSPSAGRKACRFYIKLKKFLFTFNTSFLVHSHLFKSLNWLSEQANNDTALYNLFIAIAYFFNKLKVGAKLKMTAGALEDPCFILRDRPLKNEFSPLIFSPNAGYATYYSFAALKKLNARSNGMFYGAFAALSSPTYIQSFNGDMIRTIMNNGFLRRSRTLKLMEESFSFEHNKEFVQSLVDYINSNLRPKSKVISYCDDVKEALSLDFIPEYDEKRAEMSDQDYQASLLFTKPNDFFIEQAISKKDIINLDLKQLKYATSLLFFRLNTLATSVAENQFRYVNETICFSTPRAPSYLAKLFDPALELARKLHSIVHRALYKETRAKILAKAPVDSVYSKEKKKMWGLFNKAALVLMKYYASWRFILDTLKVDSEFYQKGTNLFFPILDKKLMGNLNRPFDTSIIARGSIARSSLGFFNSYYKYFFNSYLRVAPRTSFFWAKLQLSPKKGIFFNERFYSLVTHSNRRFLIFYKELQPLLGLESSKTKNYHIGIYHAVVKKYESFDFKPDALNLATIQWAGRKNFFFNYENTSFQKLKLSDIYFRYFKEKLNVTRRPLLFESFRGYLAALNLRPAVSIRTVFSVYIFFKDWILAAARALFLDNSYFYLTRSVLNYSLYFSQKSILSDLFRSFFMRAGASQQLNKIFKGPSFFALAIQLMSNDDIRGYNKLLQSLAMHSVKSKASNAAVAWLTPSSSPFSGPYQEVHSKLLSDLSITFYSIFHIPIFVKYFPFPAFFASAPSLSKFASKVLTDVHNKGAPLSADTRDWYLEYIFICHASIITRNVEGIVNFMTRILPYYKKWGDSVALMLTPLANVDFNGLGISTIRVSFRGRPSGVERARSETHTYGPVKEPALRKLYTTGSYFNKQCIVHNNGGVTNIHMWMLNS